MRGSPFFEGVSQVDAAVGDESVKLPIFYYDGSATGAFFPARLGELRRLLPDPRLSPARLAPGVGVVAIVCFQYRDTDIGPYNELAIAVALNEPWFLLNLPGRALLAGARRRQLHAWVQHLPVTTEIARAGGVELYNYPKFIGRIEFEQSETERICRLSEGSEHILTLAGKRIAARRNEQLQLFSHLWMDRQPQSSEFKISALELGVSFRPGAASLELGGAHPIAHELRRILLSRRPIQYAYVPRFEGILYGPEHLTLSLVARAATWGGSKERVRVA